MITYKTILKYMFFCHQLPERSFFFKGKQFPICARCTGILIGYIFGIVYIFLSRSTNIILEMSLIIPLALDGIGQHLGYFKSNNTRRLLTGVLAGIATICMLRLASELGLESGNLFYKAVVNR